MCVRACLCVCVSVYVCVFVCVCVVVVVVVVVVERGVLYFGGRGRYLRALWRQPMQAVPGSAHE